MSCIRGLASMCPFFTFGTHGDVCWTVGGTMRTYWALRGAVNTEGRVRAKER